MTKDKTQPPLHRVVLTGGPGAGKTVLAEAIADADHLEEYRRSIGGLTLVPEAATQVYASRRTRWDRLDDPGRRVVQREIYHFQRTQEDALAAEAYEKGHRLLLLDRGTIDGAAYWPEGPEAYWHDLGVDAKDELMRYDAVIWLESAAVLGMYDGERSNEVRFEDAESAVASGRLLEELWGAHPKLHRIAATPSLDEKLARVTEVVRKIVEGEA